MKQVSPGVALEIEGLDMGDAEQVPGAILTADEAVIINSPGFRLPSLGVIDLGECSRLHQGRGVDGGRKATTCCQPEHQPQPMVH